MANFEEIGALLLGAAGIITATATAIIQSRTLKKHERQFTAELQLREREAETTEADVAGKLSASAVAWINRLEEAIEDAEGERAELQAALSGCLKAQEELERRLMRELDERDSIIRQLCHQSQLLLNGIKVLVAQLKDNELVPSWEIPDTLIVIPPIVD